MVTGDCDEGRMVGTGSSPYTSYILMGGDSVRVWFCCFDRLTFYAPSNADQLKKFGQAIRRKASSSRNQLRGDATMKAALIVMTSQR